MSIIELRLRSRFSVEENKVEQRLTSCWKTGYQGYPPDIRGIINGYQEKIDEISFNYLTDFGRILKKCEMDIPK